MSLVFAAIAPHGTLPEAPVPGAERTHEALAELGRRFDAATPEATIVLTPHNVHVEGHFAVVLAGTLSGTLAEFDADHGHAHDPAGPYGFDPAAADYDDAIVRLVRKTA